MCLNVLPPCMPVCHCVLGAHRNQKRAFDPLKFAVIDSCKLPGGFWESNSGSQEDQPVFLTIDPCVQPLETLKKIPT